jgi:chaperonin GroEL
MHNEIIFGEEMIESLMNGMEITYEVVSKTLGGAGRNSLFRSPYSRSPVATNDGYTLARLVSLKNELEAMGADLLKQVASRQNEQVGDGTSTVIVLAYAMIIAGFTLVRRGKNPMTLKKEIIEAARMVCDEIKKKATPIQNDEDIFNIANISMENPDIAKIVVEAVKKAGKNGKVLVEESNGLTVEREDIDGIEFDRGYISPYMATNYGTMQSVMQDCLVLVTDKILSVNSDFFPLLENVSARGIKQMLVICEGMNGELLSSILKNKEILYKSLMEGKTGKDAKGFNCVVVQKPADNETLQDIATFCGAKLILNESNSGSLTESHFMSLGKAKKIIVTKDSTLLIGGSGTKEEVDERIKLIRSEMENKTLYIKEKLEERIGKLAGSIVLLKVGAPTEMEMKYLKLKVDDAVGSTRAAIEEGIVIGGGKTLFEISQMKPKTDGEKIVLFACGEPFRKIIENAGINPDYVIFGNHWWNKIFNGFFSNGISDGEVYDVVNNVYSDDPIADGLVDPAKVERCAVTNAADLAALVITLKDSFVDLPQEK